MDRKQSEWHPAIQWAVSICLVVLLVFAAVAIFGDWRRWPDAGIFATIGIVAGSMWLARRLAGANRNDAEWPPPTQWIPAWVTLSFWAAVIVGGLAYIALSGEFLRWLFGNDSGSGITAAPWPPSAPSIFVDYLITGAWFAIPAAACAWLKASGAWSRVVGRINAHYYRKVEKELDRQ